LSTDSFKNTLRKRSVFYNSAVLNMAAIKRDEQWYNCRSVILFSYESPQNVSESIVNVGDFSIYRHSSNTELMMKQIETILTTGKLSLGDNTCLFMGADDKVSSLRYENWTSRYSERSRERFNIDWPIDCFKSEVQHKFENDLQKIFDDADGKVRCLDPPFESVYDLVKSMMKIDKWDFRDSSNARGSVLYLIFPIFLGIDECSLDGNKFECKVRFHESINPSDIRLSVIEKGPITKRRQLGFGGSSMLKEPIMTARSDTTLEDVSDASIFLFLKTEAEVIDKRDLRNRRSEINRRLFAHELFDEGAEQFQNYLSGKEKQNKSSNFEWAVATLLHFCGFRTELMGSKGLGEVPDILAYPPNENAVIVGECTLTAPDSSKISLLSERARNLKESMGIDVKPTIFANVEESSLQNIPPGGEVKIVGSGKLREMFDMASRGTSADEIFDRIFTW